MLASILVVTMLAQPVDAAGERWTPAGTISTQGFTCVIYGCFLFMDSPATQSVARELRGQADITSTVIKVFGKIGIKITHTGPLSWANGVKAQVADALRKRDRGCGVVLYVYWNPFSPFHVDSQRC